MLIKLKFFFENSYMMVKSNQLRLRLTLLGVIVATIIMMAGLITINTVVSKQNEQYQDFDENVLILSGAIDQKLLMSVEATFPNAYTSVYSDIGTLEPYNVDSEKQAYKILPTVCGVSSSFLNLPLSLNNDSMDYTKIVLGRDININDINEKKRVTVISEFTSTIFFGDENPIGKIIPMKLPNDSVFNDYEIIGVYMNTLLEKQKTIDYITKNNNETNVAVDFYIPYTVLAPVTGRNVNTVMLHESNGNTVDVVGALEIMIKPYNGSVELITYENRMQLVDDIKKSMSGVLAFILFFVIAVSGLNLLNCMFFSIKERISEIGIRKAIGATNVKILLQFINESLLITIIGTLIGIIIVVIISILLSSYSVEIFRTYLRIVVTKEIIVSTIIIEILQGVIFSIVPAYYASRIKIVNALRFD
jgi:putative ABC transport system permease protein